MTTIWRNDVGPSLTHNNDTNANNDTIMASVMQPLSKFVNSLMGIFVSLMNSVFAVFQAIFALGANIVNSVLAIMKHLVTMVMELFSGIFGFIAANFVAIAVLGGAYYIYTVYQSRNRGSLKARN
ncbi:hypothetical protein BDZ97DRAFT_1787055 [Flammula alnicola]|nr:hypothetical protein BDZ97DRAFT_1787055 [Flammula alnicola]